MRMPMCDTIHHLWITSNDHFTKQIHLFSNQKLFGCYTSMIIHIQNSCVFCEATNFRGLTAGFRTPSNTFWTFTMGVFDPVRVFHPRENLALLAITRHKFSFTIPCNCATLLDFVQRTKSTQSITKHSVDFQPCTHTHSMRCPLAYAM